MTGKDSGGMMYGYSGMSSDEEESQKYITDDVIKDLKNVAHVKSAEPILSISVIALKGKYEGFIELTGMTPEGLKTLNLELEDGDVLDVATQSNSSTKKVLSRTETQVYDAPEATPTPEPAGTPDPAADGKITEETENSVTPEPEGEPDTTKK